MFNRSGRFLSFLLALCLILTGLPAGANDAAQAEAAVYGMTTASGVNVRQSASTKAGFWFKLDNGYICEVLKEVDSGGIHWYKVSCVHPDPDSTRKYVGYIHGNYFRLLTETETADYLAGKAIAEQYASSTPTPVPDTSKSNVEASGTGTVTNGGTNFREGPSMSSHSIMKLDRGTVVTITSIPETVDSNHWYGVNYAGYSGYIRSDFITLNSVITDYPTGLITPTPTPTPTPTSVGPTATPTDYSQFNAVQLILTSCHLRVTPSPNGSYNRANDWVGQYTIKPLAGSPVVNAGYTWFPVLYNTKTYYVRSDCVQLIYDPSIGTPTPVPTATPEGWTPTPTPTATPTAAPTAAPTSTSAVVLGYVMTIKGGVNLRATIAGTVIKQLPKYVTVPYLLTPVKKSGYTWYYVDYNGLRGYLRSDVVKVVSDTPTNTPTPTVDPTASGYVTTTASGVNLRTGAGYGNKTKGRVDKGVTMPYYGEPTTVKNVQWYYVKHPTLGYGYIHGGFVTVQGGETTPTPTPTETGSVTPTPTPAVTGIITPVPTGSTKPEASYTTLKKGSTGTAVKKLVTALKNQGYYSGSIISTYTSAIVTAVKAFQAANGITVDGVAGAATQHALYGTVPEGTNTTLTMDIYPAEKIDWWSGGINELWAKGTNYKIYDVKTGIVWWAHRWSGGYHVDAEPLTAGDTARLCKCYGVTTSAEIANQNLYQRRPCLVTIGTRTFACSLYGVPHNYPDGDTISTNEFKGQLCIHFTNSWTHGSKKVDSLHAEAIQYAYDNAPNGHK